MAETEELKRLDAFTALLDDVEETLPMWTDMPYDLFAASAKVCEGLHEWAVKKRAATVEATPALGLEPGKAWAWPGLERQAEGEGRIFPDADQDATEPLALAAESLHDPKVGTLSNPDF